MSFAESRNATLVRWLHPLSTHLCRAAADIAAVGLRAPDFPAQSVLVTLEDGTVCVFKRAFHLPHPEDGRWVCVFSEHAGYHEFVLGPDDTVRVG